MRWTPRPGASAVNCACTGKLMVPPSLLCQFGTYTDVLRGAKMGSAICSRPSSPPAERFIDSARLFTMEARSIGLGHDPEFYEQARSTNDTYCAGFLKQTASKKDLETNRLHSVVNSLSVDCVRSVCAPFSLSSAWSPPLPPHHSLRSSSAPVATPTTAYVVRYPSSAVCDSRPRN